MTKAMLARDEPALSPNGREFLLFASILYNSDLCLFCCDRMVEHMGSAFPAARDDLRRAAAAEADKKRLRRRPLEPVALHDANLPAPHLQADQAMWIAMFDDPEWWGRTWRSWFLRLMPFESGHGFDENVLGAEWRRRLWFALFGRFTALDVARGRDVVAYLGGFADYVRAVYVEPLAADGGNLDPRSPLAECTCPHSDELISRCLDRADFDTAEDDIELMAMPLALERMDACVRDALGPVQGLDKLSAAEFLLIWDDDEAVLGLGELIDVGNNDAEAIRAAVEREKTNGASSPAGGCTAM